MDTAESDRHGGAPKACLRHGVPGVAAIAKIARKSNRARRPFFAAKARGETAARRATR